MSSQSALIKAQFKVRRPKNANSTKSPASSALPKTKAAPKKPSPPKPNTPTVSQPNVVASKAPVPKSTPQVVPRSSGIAPVGESQSSSSIASRIRSNGASPLGEAQIIIEQIQKSPNPKLNSSLLSALLEIELSATEVYKLKLKEVVVGWKSRQRVYHNVANLFLGKLAQIDDESIHGVKRKSVSASAVEAKKTKLVQPLSQPQQGFKRRPASTSMKNDVPKKSQQNAHFTPGTAKSMNSAPKSSEVKHSSLPDRNKVKRSLPERDGVKHSSLTERNDVKDSSLPDNRREVKHSSLERDGVKRPLAERNNVKHSSLTQLPISITNAELCQVDNDLNLSDSSDDSDDELEELLQKSVISTAPLVALPATSAPVAQDVDEKAEESDSDESDSENDLSESGSDESEDEGVQENIPEIAEKAVEGAKQNLLGGYGQNCDLDDLFGGF